MTRLQRWLHDAWHYLSPCFAYPTMTVRRQPLFLESLEVREMLSVTPTISWDGGAGNLNASDAVNWTGDRLPDATDDVYIGPLGSPGHIYLFGNLAVHSLHSEAKLQLSGTLSVAADSELLAAVDLMFSGGINVLGGDLVLGGGGISWGSINVAAGAELTVADDYTLSSMMLGGLTLAGTLEVAAEGTLHASQGTVTLEAGSAIVGAGMTEIAGATLQVNGLATARNLRLAVGSQLTGPGDLHILNVLDWDGGTMRGTGTTRILAGATLQLDANSTAGRFFYERTIENAGTVRWLGGGLRATMGAGGTLRNLAGGLVEVLGADEVYSLLAPPMPGFPSSPITVENFGTFRVDCGAGIFQFSNTVFNNAALVEVLSGRLVLDAGENSGALTLATGGVVEVHGDYSFLADSAASGAGVVVVTGTLEIPTGTEEGEDAATVANLRLEGSGEIKGAGDLLVSQLFEWRSGTLSGVGRTVVGATAMLNLAGEGTRTLDRKLLRYGGLTWDTNGAIRRPSTGEVYTNNRIPHTTAPTTPTFNADAAADALYRAMFPGLTGWGSDRDAVFREFDGRTAAQIRDIRAAYAAHYLQHAGVGGRTLDTDLQSELGAQDYTRLQALLVGTDTEASAAGESAADRASKRVNADVVAINRAITGYLTDLKDVYRILEAADTTAKMDMLKAVYQARYNISLEADLSARLDRAHDREQTKALLDGERALADAIALHRALSGTFYNDRAPLFEILSNRTPTQLQAIATAYQGKYNGALVVALEAGLYEAEAQRAKALLAGDPIKAAAARLRAAMEGTGANAQEVWAALEGKTSDQRAMIALTYEADYHEELKSRIESEFSDGFLFGTYADYRSKTFKLLYNGGLNGGERIWYASRGWGADHDEIMRVLGNRSAADLATIRSEYNYVSGRNLDDDIVGTGWTSEFGGRKRFDAQQALLGKPTTVAEAMQRLQARYDYDRSGWSNSFNNGWQWLFNEKGTLLDHNYNKAVEAYNGLSNPATLDINDAAAADFRKYAGFTGSDIEQYRTARDAGANAVGTVLGTAAGVAVVIGSGGTATPLVIGLAAGVGGVSQTLGAALARGGFVWEEIPYDALLGMINGGTAVLTGGNVTATTRWGILRQTSFNTARAGFSAGALTSAVATAIEEGTWQDGVLVGLLRVAQGTALGGVMGGLLGGALGGLGATFQISGAAAYIRRGFAYVTHPWWPATVGGSATTTFRAALEATLPGILANHEPLFQQLVAKLSTLARNADEAAVRSALQQVLDAASTQGVARQLLEDASVAAWHTVKGGAAAELTAFLKGAVIATALQEAETLDSLVATLVAKDVNQEVARQQARQILAELATLGANPTDDAVRGVLQAQNRLNLAGDASEELVAATKSWLANLREELNERLAGAVYKTNVNNHDNTVVEVYKHVSGDAPPADPELAIVNERLEAMKTILTEQADRLHSVNPATLDPEAEAEHNLLMLLLTEHSCAEAAIRADRAAFGELARELDLLTVMQRQPRGIMGKINGETPKLLPGGPQDLLAGLSTELDKHGSRAVVVLELKPVLVDGVWKEVPGHVFNAENINGNIWIFEAHDGVAVNLSQQPAGVVGLEAFYSLSPLKATGCYNVILSHPW